MNLAKFLQLIQLSAQFLAAATALLLLLRLKLPRWWNWSVTAWGLGVFVLLALSMEEPFNDLLIFWNAGQAILDERSPYGDALFLNPPNTLWFFAFAGLLELEILKGLLLVLNMTLYAGLAYLACVTLRAQDQTKTFQLSPDIVGVCAVLLAMSLSARYGLALGQLSALVAAVLFGALWFQARGYPVLAGACLLVGQIKIGSMLPFLLLFLRKRDIPTWVTLIAGGFVLSVLGAFPGEWIELSRQCLRNIKALGEPGMVNDISFASPVSHEVLGPDHLLYRLGIREPRLLQWGQLAFLFAGSAWIGWLLHARPHWSRAGLCAMVACFSDLFLYHRFYSTIILALPLVYALGRCREGGPGSRLYGLAFLSCVGTLYMRVAWLGAMTVRFGEDTGIVGRVVQAFVLPYPTWLILAALASLALAESKRFRQAPLGSAHN